MKAKQLLLIFVSFTNPTLCDSSELHNAECNQTAPDPQVSDRLINDIHSHITFEALQSKGFVITSSKSRNKLFVAVKAKTKAAFFSTPSKKILINSDIYSNNLFDKGFLLIGKEENYFFEKYKLKIGQYPLIVSDSEGFTNITLFFEQGILVRIKTASIID